MAARSAHVPGSKYDNARRFVSKRGAEQAREELKLDDDVPASSLSGGAYADWSGRAVVSSGDLAGWWKEFFVPPPGTHGPYNTDGRHRGWFTGLELGAVTPYFPRYLFPKILKGMWTKGEYGRGLSHGGFQTRGAGIMGTSEKQLVIYQGNRLGIAARNTEQDLEAAAASNDLVVGRGAVEAVAEYTRVGAAGAGSVAKADARVVRIKKKRREGRPEKGAVSQIARQLMADPAVAMAVGFQRELNDGAASLPSVEVIEGYAADSDDHFRTGSGKNGGPILGPVQLYDGGAEIFFAGVRPFDAERGVKGDNFLGVVGAFAGAPASDVEVKQRFLGYACYDQACKEPSDGGFMHVSLCPGWGDVAEAAGCDLLRVLGQDEEHFVMDVYAGGVEFSPTARTAARIKEITTSFGAVPDNVYALL